MLAHAHPGEIIPSPSIQDRKVLKKIGQRQSVLISGMSGMQVTFTASPFDDVYYDEEGGMNNVD